MHTKSLLILGFLILHSGFSLPARAQGSSLNSFTYQGRLIGTNGPATGLYDVSFTLFPSSTGGSSIGATITRALQPVTNGLFTVLLEFVDATSFPGADRWLEIAVRPGGVGATVTLSPRQQITAAPYAIRAQEAANLSGTLPLAQLPAAVVTNNGSALTLGGTFAGNGAGLSNVNATTLGGLTSAGFWRTNGNVGANPTNGAFIGTADDLPVELRANNVRLLRLEPVAEAVISSLSAPNIIGGWAGNQVANGAIGATVWGGGFGPVETYGNSVAADFGTVSGGRQNLAGGAEATVAGGRANNAGGGSASIGGGYANSAMANSVTVGGGQFHTIAPGADAATIGGGNQNTIQSNAFNTTIGGGAFNAINSNGWRGTVGGGHANNVGAPEGTVAGGAFNHALGFSSTIGGGGGNAASGGWATIAGGRDHMLTNADYASIGGGVQNTIQTNAPFSTIGGGGLNVIRTNALRSTVGGGWVNTVGAGEGTVAGGAFNSALGFSATIGGGGGNLAGGEWSTIAGGRDNLLTNASYATIGGGVQNTISSNGFAATIPGGWLNTATDFAFAAGHRAKAIHTGAFVWADATAADFASTGGNQFLIRAGGGVGINNNNPNGAALAVGGDVNVEGIVSVNALSAATVTTPQMITPRIGAAGNAPLEFYVGNQRALRLETTPFTDTVNVIGGSPRNFVGAGAVGATIGGGGSGNYLGNAYTNSVEGNFSTVSGGAMNAIREGAWNATIGGGLNNQIEFGSQYGTVGGGDGNVIQVGNSSATISGGFANTIQSSGNFSTIGGGADNTIQNGNYANTLAGGNFNTILANSSFATIPGGWANSAASYAFAAGKRAKAKDTGTFVWADSTEADFTSTSSNQFLIRASGGVGINTTNPGNAALSVNGNQTVSGGLLANQVDVNNGLTVGAAAAIGSALTVGGNAEVGGNVSASGSLTIGNTATVNGNLTSGGRLAVSGLAGLGTSNPQAQLHVYSVANPTVARIQSAGTPGFGRLEFVSDPLGSATEWRPGYVQAADNGGFTGGLSFVVNGTGFANRFAEVETMRIVNGRVGIGTPTPVSALQVVGTVTATAFNPPSDRNLKENFEPVRPRDVLEKVAAMTITRWNFKGDAGTPHVGPMAQDFHAAFGLGTDERHIATVDADGIALAAIQGLNQKVEEQRAENADLRRELAELRKLVQRLAP